MSHKIYTLLWCAQLSSNSTVNIFERMTSMQDSTIFRDNLGIMATSKSKIYWIMANAIKCSSDIWILRSRVSGMCSMFAFIYAFTLKRKDINGTSHVLKVNDIGVNVNGDPCYFILSFMVYIRIKWWYVWDVRLILIMRRYHSTQAKVLNIKHAQFY